jgi:signal transduction histidine kinase/CheY-like chemotaxis protein/PAS domain-containing protein
MDVSLQRIKEIGAAFPGSTAIYRARGEVLETLYSSPDIPGMLGMTPEEYDALTMPNAINIILLGDRPLVQAMLQRCIAGEEQSPDIYFRVVQKIDGFAWVHLRAKIIGSIDGDPVASVSFTNASVETDIYRDIINHTNDMIYVCDCGTYEILYANEAARQYRQKEARTPFGMPCYAYIHDYDAPCKDCFMKRMKPGENLRLTRFNEVKDTWEHLHGEYIDWCGHQAFVQYIEDVTDSETLRQDLERTEKCFKMAVESAGMSVWEYDIQKRRIFYTNESFAKYDLPAVIENVPESILDRVVPEDREKLRDLYRRLEAGESPLTSEYQMIDRQGSKSAYMRTMYMTVCDQQGRPTTAYGAAIDVTAQKREQESYHNGIQTLLTSNPRSLCTFEFDLTNNKCNEGHGTSRYIIDRLQADTVDGVFDNYLQIIPDVREQRVFLDIFDRQKLIRKFEEGKKSYSLDYHRYNEKNKLISVRTFLNLLKNPDTGAVICIAYSLDITAQKQQESIVKILTGLECQMVAILDTDSREIEGAYLGNKLPEAYRRFYKKPGDVCSAAELRRHIMANLVLPEDTAIYHQGTIIDDLPQKLESAGHVEFIVRFKPEAPETTPTYHRFQHYWLDEMSRRILIVMTDVTQSVLHQQEDLERERRLRMQANAANDAKTEFLSRMSHNMRTPLNVILGITHLSMERGHTPKTMAELEKIDSVSRIMLGLINDILDLSKAESGHMTLNPEPYPADEFYDYIDAFARPLCEEKDLHFVLDAHPLTEVAPMMDKLHANQVLFNLLSNAAKFTPEGGTVTLGLYQHMTSAGKLAMKVVVSDTGMGMSQTFLNELFEPFTQEQRNDVSRERGTGLGLSIVKQIADLMGGQIAVSSELGKGTAFTLTGEFDCVPIEEVQAQKEETTVRDVALLSGKCMLLCEDHPLNQEIARALLEEKGITVDIAENGETGLQKFARSSPGQYDVILMDIRMPVLDGYAATGRIRALSRPDAQKVPIVAMTANAFAEDIQKCLQAGMNGHIAKPIDPENLYQTLLAVME